VIKLFQKTLFLIILFLIFPAISFADVSKVVFVTDPQTIKPDILSGPITIQTQDSGGNEYKTPETIDIQFISTSATGQFLGSTGKPATTYMSSGTANKTFYYKDSSEGTFTITINIRGRNSGIELDADQTITVSSGASQNNNSDNQSEVLGDSDTDNQSPSAQLAQSSGGGSTTNVSTQNAKFEISAGSDRATSPGSPIWFQAVVKKNTTGANAELNWSFGDGNVGVGQLVSHTYKYSGDYVVVLSSKAGDIFSVSRLKVKVTDLNILVADKGGYLEISNNSNAEVNLFNWKVENAGKGFIFQPNTIILPHSSIKVEKNLLTMKGYDNSLGTSLKNSLKEEIFAIAPVKEINFVEASKNLENIKREAVVIQEKVKNLNVASVVSANLIQVATSTDNIIYEAPKQTGFISRLTNFIKRVFSR
jgi:hypothetical protein